MEPSRCGHLGWHGRIVPRGLGCRGVTHGGRWGRPGGDCRPKEGLKTTKPAVENQRVAVFDPEIGECAWVFCSGGSNEGAEEDCGFSGPEHFVIAKSVSAKGPRDVRLDAVRTLDRYEHPRRGVPSIGGENQYPVTDS